MDAIKTVTVVRPFCLEGQRKEVGDQIDVPRLLAVELVSFGKAQYTAPADEAPVQATPASTTRKRK